MDCDMQKKVTIFVNDFTPGKEGVSNELNLLMNHLARDPNLKIILHNISSTSTFTFSSSHISYGLPFLPLGMLLTKYIERASDLIHIYGSLTGRLYMKILKRKPLLLTNASAIKESRVEECSKYWHKLDKVVVECHRDEKRVVDYGIEPSKVSLLFPAVNVPAFSYHPPDDGFKVGFASSPIANDNLGIHNRGINLLLSVAPELPDVDFLLLWRRKHFDALQTLLNKSISSNVSVINRILPDMNTFYGSVHCTILPSAFMDDCKPCPNSIMESLAAGKPVLVSHNVGISDLIAEEGCGLVFKPEVADIMDKITEIKYNYSHYQSKARQTAEKHFSVPRFVKQYTQLYNELTES